jgi:hypothetical protein
MLAHSTYASISAIPTKWDRFKIQPAAPGISTAAPCVAAAAHWIDVGGPKPYQRLVRLSRAWPQPLAEKHVRILADAVSLALYRPQKQSLTELFERGHLWIARVARANEPQRYVLVLQWLPDACSLVIADPASEPQVRAWPVEDFAACWRPLSGRQRWAASIHCPARQ